MAKAARTIYGDRLPDVAEFLGCMAERNLPITLGRGASYLTDKLLEKGLKRIGLESVKKAGQFAIAGTLVGTTIGC